MLENNHSTNETTIIAKHVQKEYKLYACMSLNSGKFKKYVLTQMPDDDIIMLDACREEMALFINVVTI